MILCDTIDSLIRSFTGYAIEHNLTPFISMQNHYNLVYREEEREMMPVLNHFGVGSIPWSPLARGTVCRPLSQQSQGSGRAAVDQYVHQTLNVLISHFVLVAWAAPCILWAQGPRTLSIGMIIHSSLTTFV